MLKHSQWTESPASFKIVLEVLNKRIKRIKIIRKNKITVVYCEHYCVYREPETTNR